jgi:hypothetical protein
MANPVEKAALQHCAKLLTTATARRLPKDQAEGLVTAAFVMGAAWALDDPKIMEMADAQIDAVRAAREGRVS